MVGGGQACRRQTLLSINNPLLPLFSSPALNTQSFHTKLQWKLKVDVWPNLFFSRRAYYFVSVWNHTQLSNHYHHYHHGDHLHNYKFLKRIAETLLQRNVNWSIPCSIHRPHLNHHHHHHHPHLNHLPRIMIEIIIIIIISSSPYHYLSETSVTILFIANIIFMNIENILTQAFNDDFYFFLWRWRW